MKIKPMPIIKGVSSFIASASIGAIVENAIMATTPSTINRYQKILVVVGKILLTTYLSHQVEEYVGKTFDEVIEKKKDDDKSKPMGFVKV